MNINNANKDYLVSSLKNTSTKANTSTKENTSTKANTSFQYFSSNIEENELQDNSQEFQKPEATIDHIINPNIEVESIQQAYNVNSPNQASVSYNHPHASQPPTAVFIGQKIKGLKNEFKTVLQKMLQTGFTTYQSYMMNKKKSHYLWRYL